MVLMGGMIVVAQMGDPNASIPTPQPVYTRPTGTRPAPGWWRREGRRQGASEQEIPLRHRQSAGGVAGEQLSFRFGAPVAITIAGCRYESVPVTVTRADDPPFTSGAY